MNFPGMLDHTYGRGLTNDGSNILIRIMRVRAISVMGSVNALQARSTLNWTDAQRPVPRPGECGRRRYENENNNNKLTKKKPQKTRNSG